MSLKCYNIIILLCHFVRGVVALARPSVPLLHPRVVILWCVCISSSNLLLLSSYVRARQINGIELENAHIVYGTHTHTFPKHTLASYQSII